MNALTRRVEKLEQHNPATAEWMWPCIRAIKDTDGKLTAAFGERQFAGNQTEAEDEFRGRVERELTRAGNGDNYRWIVRVLVNPPVTA